VVVDGQEKLVDGSNVCPQQARGTGAKGASGSTGPSGATTSTGNTGKNATAPTPDAEHKKKSNAQTGGPTQ
jgi:hypothetical protein